MARKKAPAKTTAEAAPVEESAVYISRRRQPVSAGDLLDTPVVPTPEPPAPVAGPEAAPTNPPAPSAMNEWLQDRGAEIAAGGDEPQSAVVETAPVEEPPEEPPIEDAAPVATEPAICLGCGEKPARGTGRQGAISRGAYCSDQCEPLPALRRMRMEEAGRACVPGLDQIVRHYPEEVIRSWTDHWESGSTAEPPAAEPPAAEPPAEAPLPEMTGTTLIVPDAALLVAPDPAFQADQPAFQADQRGIRHAADSPSETAPLDSDPFGAEPQEPEQENAMLCTSCGVLPVQEGSDLCVHCDSEEIICECGETATHVVGERVYCDNCLHDITPEAIEEQAPDPAGVDDFIARMRREQEIRDFVREPLPSEVQPEVQPEVQNAEVPQAADESPGVVLRDLPVESILPSPFQVRTHFDEMALVDLATSIQEHGVLEPVVVRARDDGRWELIMGERRLRASIMAGKTTIPALIRQATDQEAMDMGLVENLVREDIRVMELARGYAKMSEMGYSQSQIAGKVKRSQPSVANTIRLLALPEKVQEFMDSGDLALAHGIGLLRFADWPDVCSRIAELAVAHEATSRFLSTGIPYLNMLLDEGLLRQLDTYHCQFDRSICMDCPFEARIDVDIRSCFCARPEHWDQLQNAAIHAEKQQAAEQLQKARQAAEEAKNTRVLETLNTVAPAVRSYDPDEAEQEAGEELPEWAHQARAADVEDTNAVLEADPLSRLPKLSDLPVDSFCRVVQGQVPEGCSENCTCRAACLDWSGNHAVPICLDPARYKSLKAQTTRGRKKRIKAQHEAWIKELTTDAPRYVDPRRLAVVVERAVRDLPVEVRRDVAKGLRAEADDQDMIEEARQWYLDAAKLLEEHVYRRTAEKAWEVLSLLHPDTLTNLAAECLVRAELKDKLDYAIEEAPLTEFILQASGQPLRKGRSLVEVLTGDPPERERIDQIGESHVALFTAGALPPDADAAEAIKAYFRGDSEEMPAGV